MLQIADFGNTGGNQQKQRMVPKVPVDKVAGSQEVNLGKFKILMMSCVDLSIRPNPDGRKNKNTNGPIFDETAE